jgi:hypothetical protein
MLCHVVWRPSQSRCGDLCFDHVARAGVYLTSMSDFVAMNGIYAKYFSQPFPARTTIAVAALPLGACVEIDLVVEARGDARAQLSSSEIVDRAAINRAVALEQGISAYAGLRRCVRSCFDRVDARPTQHSRVAISSNISLNSFAAADREAAR